MTLLLRRTASQRVQKAPSIDSFYPFWFYIPAGVVYGLMFLVPTFASFYFSLTHWTLFDQRFIGLDNFREFFAEPFLLRGLINTFIFGFTTSAGKVALGMMLAVLLTSNIYLRSLLRSVIFFPVLVSTIGIGITFTVLMEPHQGVINTALQYMGIQGPRWLTSPSLAIYSVALVEIWRGVGLATLILIAGLVSIPTDYYEAARLDGANAWQQFWRITVPLSRPAVATVITLSLIDGLRTFDLVWAMTRGGPGFSSDVLASVIYKQYQAGFYGLSTAGNVTLFLVIAVVALPIVAYLNREES
ncbi:sugar ABC transporter permease [Natronospirillum operosum]|uniref:Sugar ABC transporter permease n=1 Tax=Natronospirillum operosum TaxID=2759953 RepID=A0A4Z0W6Q0_9GAMM|nr:sugar ABC transporter permease [Natronospirillum operosum]TGG93504.1 sugar ABC transporter permease [Natronospirillum operosum]